MLLTLCLISMKANLKKMQDCNYFFIDFNDSFSMNIVSELFDLGIHCEYFNCEEIFKIQEKLDANKRNYIILGPGPGSPGEYGMTKKFIQKYYDKTNIRFFGICLGHQILMEFLGATLSPRRMPVHGQTREIHLPHWPEFKNYQGSRCLTVQEYNSLCVNSNANLHKIEFVEIDSEVIMARSQNFISYQFHPESVGTSRPKLFFEFLLQEFS